MPGQVQELQVPGTPEGGSLARVLARTLPYTGQYYSILLPRKIARHEPGGAEERSVPCPDDPRSQWQFFNKIEQNEKRKWRSECICCGQMYWDVTPSKILEHFGFQSTRQTAAKFKPCKGIEKDEHEDVNATVQRIHAAEFAAKSALKLAKEQGSRTQQAAHDEFFHGVA